MSYDFHCRDAGATSCGAHITAGSEAELREKLAEHLRKHDVETPNETLLDHLVASAEQR